MDSTKPITSESDFRTVLRRIEMLMDAEKDTPELEELICLTRMVEKYEDEHYPLGSPS